MVSRAQQLLSQQHSPRQNFVSQTPSIEFKTYSQGAWCPATSYVSIGEQRLHGVTYNRGSANGGVYPRRPTGLETQEKNDRDRITLITGTSLRVQVPG